MGRKRQAALASSMSSSFPVTWGFSYPPPPHVSVQIWEGLGLLFITEVISLSSLEDFGWLCMKTTLSTWCRRSPPAPEEGSLRPSENEEGGEYWN